MKRRDFVAGAAALGLSACAPGSRSEETAGAPTKSASRPPNIFYICVDDLGTSLGCYGNDQVVSPHIDAFARDAVLFEEAHCQIAVCTASRTSILTGLRPETTLVTKLNDDWRAALPGVASLPQHLQAGGYNTISIGKIWDPRAGAGSNEGWTEKQDEWGVEFEIPDVIEAVDRASARDEPFALFLGFKEPHCPWEPPAEALAAYEGRTVTPDGPGRTITSGYLQKCSGANTRELSDDLASDITRRYYGSVTKMDAQVGALMAYLKRTGHYDDAVIVFWSGDHGYHLGQNDHWGKWTTHVASSRVPLLMRVPGVTQGGTRSPRLVETVDMYPTLLDLAGLPAPDHALEGRSFARLLSEPEAGFKDHAFTFWRPDDQDPARAQSFSVKTERYNYIWHIWGSEELFDHQEDPGEENDLHITSPDIVAELRTVLLEHYKHAIEN